MKIGVLGSGISGLTVAYYLNKDGHEVSLFEKNDYLGGHTHTHQIELEEETYLIDTGFIVFNDWTYPNFIKLIEELEISYKLSDMSFSVFEEKTDFEYNGSNLNTLFANRRHFIKPSFYQFILSILKFNLDCKKLFRQDSIPQITLNDYIRNKGYHSYFAKYYLQPIISAIWSTKLHDVDEMPLEFFIQFFIQYGLFNLFNRPNWFTIESSSNAYIQPMIQDFKDTVYTNTEVVGVSRSDDKVTIKLRSGDEFGFDKIIIATHSDQACQLLSDVTSIESENLNKIKYQENDIVLHYDDKLLPKKRLARASWNYCLGEENTSTVTYYMNRLQNISSKFDFCVTLNQTEKINPSKILKRLNYSHPVYTNEALTARNQLERHNGCNNTYFCGAYFGNGFHEDGVKSALNVVNKIRGDYA